MNTLVETFLGKKPFELQSSSERVWSIYDNKWVHEKYDPMTGRDSFWVGNQMLGYHNGIFDPTLGTGELQVEYFDLIKHWLEMREYYASQNVFQEEEMPAIFVGQKPSFFVAEVRQWVEENKPTPKRLPQIPEKTAIPLHG